MKITKILSMIMNFKLKIKEHIVKKTTQSLITVIMLRKLRLISSLIIKQLYKIIITLIINYIFII